MKYPHKKIALFLYSNVVSGFYVATQGPVVLVSVFIMGNYPVGIFLVTEKKGEEGYKLEEKKTFFLKI